MSRSYDSRTTTFSPEGRLFQIEYAMEAISHAPTAVAIHVNKEPLKGILIASKKNNQSKLSGKTKSATEKTIQISDDIFCCVAGLISDANIIVNYAREVAQDHFEKYNEQIQIEKLVRIVCDLKQAYTQHGGLRPYGTSFLWFGWDISKEFQLYKSEPSGNYSSWVSVCIGKNETTAMSVLKEEYPRSEEGEVPGYLTLDQAKKILLKTMEKATEDLKTNKEELNVFFLHRQNQKTFLSVVDIFDK